jgi:hypothetical protein
VRRGPAGNAEWQQRTVNGCPVVVHEHLPSIQNVSDDFPNKATVLITSLLPCVVATLDVIMTSLPATYKNRVDLDAPNMEKINAFSFVYAVGFGAVTTDCVTDEASPDASSYC